MFTGIVSAVGKIISIKPLGDGQRIAVEVKDWPLHEVLIGDSILHSGCCLTVVEKQLFDAGGVIASDVSAHTLTLVSGLTLGQDVNLEKSLRLMDRLGGHLVSGHVDGTARVTRYDNIAESWLLEVALPPSLARYVAKKGSICLHGVSLTINAVHDAPNETLVQANIIPHTHSATAFKSVKPGDRLNVEVDLIARYAERLALPANT